MSLIVILDFDGVIVDSIKGLYNCFAKFLKEYGCEVDQKAFDRYNGMKLDDILIDIKSRYKISNSIKDLKKIMKNLCKMFIRSLNCHQGLKNF